MLRGLMIGLGAALVHEVHWVLSLFAAFLIYAGLKILIAGDEEEGDFQNSAVVRWFKTTFRVTPDLHGQRFTVRKTDPKTGKVALYFTPLALALVLVNGADVIFAVDSVPAIFAITTDTFVVYTSNIFAILGLRALYFALAAMVDRFAYLKTALAFILIFIGAKIVVADTFGLIHVQPWVSLVVTLTLLAAGVFYSLWRTRTDASAAAAPEAAPRTRRGPTAPEGARRAPGPQDAGSAAIRSRRVVMVEASATPSTRAGRKWRWNAVTTARVRASNVPVTGRS